MTVANAQKKVEEALKATMLARIGAGYGGHGLDLAEAIEHLKRAEASIQTAWGKMTEFERGIGATNISVPTGTATVNHE